MLYVSRQNGSLSRESTWDLSEWSCGLVKVFAELGWGMRWKTRWREAIQFRARSASWVYNSCSQGPVLRRAPCLVLILCCHHLEVINFWTRALTFSFAMGPSNYVASPGQGRVNIWVWETWIQIPAVPLATYMILGTFLTSLHLPNRNYNSTCLTGLLWRLKEQSSVQ